MQMSRRLGAYAVGSALWLVSPIIVPAVAALAAPAQPADANALRPAVGNPLAKAKSLMASHNYAAASAQVAIADRQKGKSAYESFVIQQMRGAIAQASGDTATASKVFQELINSGRLGGAQLTQMLLAETSLSYQTKDFKGVITWADRYTKAGGKDPAIRTLVIQAYYLQNDFVNAAKLQKAQVDEIVKARKVPPEDQLQLLAACQKQTNDGAGLQATMKLLIAYYPKPSYWADVIYALQTSPGFTDRLDYDLARFKLRVGAVPSENDFMQMVQVALGENNPGGALATIGDATDRHVFGAPDKAAREQRLTALVNKTAADTKSKLDSTVKDLRASPATTSQQLLEAGQNYVGFKQYTVGIPLMQEAIAKGDLRRPAQAQLRVAEAYVDAGNKADAVAAFKQVATTTDGTSDLAQLWLLWLQTQPTVPPSAH